MKTKITPVWGIGNEEQGTVRFLVLIPHRDTEKPLRHYCRALFAAGLEGAYSFPRVIPLGLLARPLSQGELKPLALGLRKSSLEGERGGWFRAGEPVAESFPPGVVFGEGQSLYGPLLDIPLPSPGDFPAGALLRGFSRPVLVSALIRDLPDFLPAAPSPVFRAAALANLVCRPLFQGLERPGDRDFSFEWKIGRLVWLPRCEKRYVVRTLQGL